MEFELYPHLHLLVVGGSRAYGMATETSDVDVKGVAIPPKRFFYSPTRKWHQVDDNNVIASLHNLLTPAEQEVVKKTKLEGVVFNLQKFLFLATNANPNILDLLFCRKEEVRHQSKIGKLLRDSRKLFLSAKAKHTFSGYAFSQLKRIEGHRKWLLEPPRGFPTREEHGLPPQPLIDPEQRKAIGAAIQKEMDSWNIDYGELAPAAILHIQQQTEEYLASLQLGHDDAAWTAAARKIGLDNNLVRIVMRERSFKKAVIQWKQYQTWKDSRNPERAALEDKHGYDTKHAAHLVRLLRMGREILLTGQVHVHRKSIDAEELLEIRRGSWSYNRLINWARARNKELTSLYKSKQYNVPHSPDLKAIENLSIELIERALHKE